MVPELPTGQFKFNIIIIYLFYILIEPLLKTKKLGLIWEYFEESTCDLSRVICKQCKQRVYKRFWKKMTTSSMRKHLESKHKPLYKEMLKSEVS